MRGMCDRRTGQIIAPLIVSRAGRSRTESTEGSPGRKSGGGVMPGHAEATSLRPALLVSETPTHSRLISADAAARTAAATRFVGVGDTDLQWLDLRRQIFLRLHFGRACVQ
jgi:hypothetical protein